MKNVIFKKRAFVILLALFIPALTGCISDSTAEQAFAEQTGSGTVQSTELQSEMVKSEYSVMLEKYNRAYDEHFEAAEKALESASNAKYIYTKTVYNLGSGILELTEYFCNEDSKSVVESYYALIGYKEVEYTDGEGWARVSAVKGDVNYQLDLEYNTDINAFTVKETKNGLVSECYSGILTDEGAFKVYENSNLKVTYEVFVGTDGSVKLAWTDGEVKEYKCFLEGPIPVKADFANEGTGIIEFSSGSFTGKFN